MPRKPRLALLDMNNAVPNQGMRCLRRIAAAFAAELDAAEFDVRAAGELPDASYDLYISSGGPGSPLASGEDWERRFFDLLDALWAHNRHAPPELPRKYVFFICHSFQLAIRYFGVASITSRRSWSFGTFPVTRSREGKDEPVFRGLGKRFFVADFREYQVVRPAHGSLSAIGAHVLAYEKKRPHVPYERAVMGIRFSDEWVGTQFHPEADRDGMLIHFGDADRRAAVIAEYGERRYERMMAHLADPGKIALTNDTVLPNFIRQSIAALTASAAAS